MSIRIGQGFDVHAFCEGDHVMLGGVAIPHAQGLKAHSDGDVALHALSDALLGALALGDMDYLDTDIAWLEGLLGNYGQPTELLRDYLVAYHRAAVDHLDERGAPVVAWLAKVIDGNGFR